MSEAQIAAQFAEALSAAAKAANPAASLVSMELSLVGESANGEVRTRIARQTRTLLFMEAELLDASGVRAAAASSIHKIPA
ncbi:MAG TPA: hypothetical protein VM915_07625 [Verrucomicrobiae bacterium]|nr:hypothetical protein [Verrucomicrobiae bacterium]